MKFSNRLMWGGWTWEMVTWELIPRNACLPSQRQKSTCTTRQVQVASEKIKRNNNCRFSKIPQSIYRILWTLTQKSLSVPGHTQLTLRCSIIPELRIMAQKKMFSEGLKVSFSLVFYFITPGFHLITLWGNHRKEETMSFTWIFLPCFCRCSRKHPRPSAGGRLCHQSSSVLLSLVKLGPWGAFIWS